MKEQLISFKTAKLAKEKLFDWNCFYKFVDGSEIEVNNESFSFNWNSFSNKISTPTQSLLQKWLREEKGIIIEIQYKGKEYIWIVHKELEQPVEVILYDTYEEALEEGLLEGLKLIK